MTRSCGGNKFRDITFLEKLRRVSSIKRQVLTPLLARENVISAIGPYAGNESHNERWITERVLVVAPAPDATPTVVCATAFESPYRSVTL
jgi:hypothetical protein